MAVDDSGPLSGTFREIVDHNAAANELRKEETERCTQGGAGANEGQGGKEREEEAGENGEEEGTGNCEGLEAGRELRHKWDFMLIYACKRIQNVYGGYSDHDLVVIIVFVSIQY